MSWVRRLRTGDLGPLPILLGLVLIAIIFQTLNPNFLTARNFVNLIVQMAGIATIAYGLVFVLLLGEIDLSVGYVSAVAGVGMTLLLGAGLPWWAAVAVALAAAAAIGALQGAIITVFRVPSFVVTLAGLLAWNGVVLLLVGSAGTIIIQDPAVIALASAFLPAWAGWLTVAAGVALLLGRRLRERAARRRHGLEVRSASGIWLEAALLAAGAGAAVAVANQDRGVPFVGVVLLVLLIGLTWFADRTRFGRSVRAMGGSEEAARRAGIRTGRIRVAVFALGSAMAGLGGIILASRLRSVSTDAGGGDLLLNSIAAAVIGGTSLFGGRGQVSSAVLGALVIASVENGMGLLGLSSGVKFVVTGFVLLAAVLVDSVSRRQRSAAGVL
ncbi:MAG: sugar ABC transporter permease [Gemmatimonadetes bacterium]|nr:sugar ABC transporter permease [Gemmatimonadota bacterium]